MDQAPGWYPDPENEGEERYWSGAAWTDRVRPAGKAVTLHLPEHVPELQRALAAATTDIDAVEDRLSTLFERTATVAGGDGAGPYDVEIYLDFEIDEADLVDGIDEADLGDVVDEGDGGDDGFAELDAALAAEQPEDVSDRTVVLAGSRKKGLFRRRS